MTWLGDSIPSVHCSAVYDGRRDRRLVFGGRRGSGEHSSEIASVELQPLAVSSPTWHQQELPGFTMAGTAFDPSEHSTFVVGGYGDGLDGTRGSFLSQVVAIRAHSDQSVGVERLPVSHTLAVRGRFPWAAAGHGGLRCSCNPAV